MASRPAVGELDDAHPASARDRLDPRRDERAFVRMAHAARRRSSSSVASLERRGPDDDDDDEEEDEDAAESRAAAAADHEYRHSRRLRGILMSRSSVGGSVDAISSASDVDDDGVEHEEDGLEDDDDSHADEFNANRRLREEQYEQRAHEQVYAHAHARAARYDLDSGIHRARAAYPSAVADPVASSSSSRGSDSVPSTPARVRVLDELLRCFICYGRTRSPHLCPSCSKIGCRDCYVSWLERGVQSCPFCRAHLTVARLVNCRFMNDMVAALGELGVDVDEKTPTSRTSAGGSNGANNSGGAAAAGASSSSCPTHPTQSLSYYCLTCSSALCSDCAMFDAVHRGHEFAKLDSIYTDHVALIRLELDALRARLSQLDHARATIESQVSQLHRRKEDASKDVVALLQEVEAGLVADLQKRLVSLVSRKSDVTKESHLLSRLIVDLSQQLDPVQLPKHQLIQRTPDIIHHLYEMHQKPLLLSGPADADAAPDASPGCAFASELVPEFYCSPLVRVANFQRKRREGQQEEEHIRQCKLAHAQYQLRLQQQQQQSARPAAAGASSDVADAAADSSLPASASLPPPPPPVPTATREIHYSAPMLVHGQTWRLKLYLNGNGIAKGNYLSVFVELTASQLQRPAAAGGDEAVRDHEESDGDEEEEKDAPSPPFDVEPAASASSSSPSASGEFPLGSPRPLAVTSPPPPNANKYEYRVEMLPHPRHYPQLRHLLSTELLSSTSPHSPLASQTVATYVSHLLYLHAMDEALCASLQEYSSKIVSRVFASNYSPSESWGYNRYYRIDLLREEGYLAAAESSAPSAASSSSQPAESDQVPAAASSAPPAEVDDHDEDELLFKFYIRPPTYYLQSHEQRAWIEQLEQHARAQAKEIARLRKNVAGGVRDQPQADALPRETSTIAHARAAVPTDPRDSPPLSSAARPTSSLPPPRPATSSSSAALTSASFPRLTAAEITHAISTQPAATIPSAHSSSTRQQQPPMKNADSHATNSADQHPRARVPTTLLHQPAARATPIAVSEVLHLHNDTSASHSEDESDVSTRADPHADDHELDDADSASSVFVAPSSTLLIERAELHPSSREISDTEPDVGGVGVPAQTSPRRPPLATTAISAAAAPPSSSAITSSSSAAAVAASLPSHPLASFARLAAVSSTSMARLARVQNSDQPPEHKSDRESPQTEE